MQGAAAASRGVLRPSTRNGRRTEGAVYACQSARWPSQLQLHHRPVSVYAGKMSLSASPCAAIRAAGTLARHARRARVPPVTIEQDSKPCTVCSLALARGCRSTGPSRCCSCCAARAVARHISPVRVQRARASRASQPQPQREGDAHLFAPPCVRRWRCSRRARAGGSGMGAGCGSAARADDEGMPWLRAGASSASLRCCCVLLLLRPLRLGRGLPVARRSFARARLPLALAPTAGARRHLPRETLPPPRGPPCSLLLAASPMCFRHTPFSPSDDRQRMPCVSARSSPALSSVAQRCGDGGRRCRAR
jgi:hypothetical protein